MTCAWIPTPPPNARPLVIAIRPIDDDRSRVAGRMRVALGNGGMTVREMSRATGDSVESIRRVLQRRGDMFVLVDDAPCPRNGQRVPVWGLR